MKRSQINLALRQAEMMLNRYSWALPNWGKWSMLDHSKHPIQSRWLRERQLGWDVTDFGSGDFLKRGLTLFCIRNGKPNVVGERPYAEKVMFVGINQETPFHAHKNKLEDIIVRGGGTLCVEFSRDGAVLDSGTDMVYIDGKAEVLFGKVHRLVAGQSITIPKGIQHRFWGEREVVFAAEVSQCNDDITDNHFLEKMGRFSEIEEDEAPYFPLWNEVLL
ncbi:D-lyxose/D-mannose family sugar isomerase [Marinomonas posidonica]|uniref:D-lyxose ketol-isomerase n=1 Tax=Marinomonas posidonica (strain CECT 7376 / NCIMB 14433 / IVIA-Po-181) TaxID=491952 RepID=F6CZ01_MARPP|nr:D-lyxose/D-mannose family sugar isomerase [Marinomonas posidonica]AEF53128.1 protein of unknown function DUF1498 [Marinomonas posidonica IVIA-Po-181]